MHFLLWRQTNHLYFATRKLLSSAQPTDAFPVQMQHHLKGNKQVFKGMRLIEEMTWFNKETFDQTQMPLLFSAKFIVWNIMKSCNHAVDDPVVISACLTGLGRKNLWTRERLPGGSVPHWARGLAGFPQHLPVPLRKILQGESDPFTSLL